MNISLCITNYNRTGMLIDSFREVLDDPRVSEIVITDDSDLFHAAEVARMIKDWEKVKYFKNDTRLDCYRNKRESVFRATNQWVISFDSDNVMTKQYIDRIENLWIAGLNARTVYQPSFAKPAFNFERFEGLLINNHNVQQYANDGMFCTMLNAMNYFVNRDEYLRVWDGSVDPVTSDSIFQNYNWLKAGNSIYVVPGLEYEHRINGYDSSQEGSHFQKNVRRTPRGFHDSIVNKLKEPFGGALLPDDYEMGN